MQWTGFEQAEHERISFNHFNMHSVRSQLVAGLRVIFQPDELVLNLKAGNSAR